MDLICFCHLRWNFVYQRPQHLMSRFAKVFRVTYVEEPIFDTDSSYLETVHTPENVTVIVPHLPNNLNETEITDQQNRLLFHYLFNKKAENPILWFYTPMMMSYLDIISSQALTVYDCMDELSAFKNAPANIATREKQLMQIADLVFTGGHSLYKAKKNLHDSIYSFPSSIDKEHFGSARLSTTTEPDDQKMIKGPKIGFFGVIDERLDIALLDGMAALRPEYNFILIGPTVKIDPGTLPQRENIHYFGGRQYQQLPAYLKGWDVAMIPFALNESTRFISPTKTPEYLAGGRPVVSTSIADVVDPYGDNGLVYIADTAAEFVKGIDWGLKISNDSTWKKAVDNYLKEISWDNTWEKMLFRLNTRLQSKQSNFSTLKQKVHV